MAVTYTPGELLADLIGHAVAIAASIAGLVVLVLVGSSYTGAVTVTSYAVYGGSLLLVFALSALYHGLRHVRFRALLRVADHAAVYVLIAGTYTPVTLISVQGAWGWSLFGVVWGIAVAGILLKTLLPGRLERLSIGLYLVLGWVGLAGIEPLIESLPWPALALLGGGGVLFSVGVVFHRWTRLPFHNFIWHVFVMAGATAHYFSIIYFVRPAAL